MESLEAGQTGLVRSGLERSNCVCAKATSRKAKEHFTSHPLRECLPQDGDVHLQCS